MTNEELVLEYQNGNKEALNELIEQNKGLVIYFANKYQGLCSKTTLQYDDLIQEGWIGFMNAARKYEVASSEASATFSSYAGVAIKGRILQAINRSIPRMKKSDHASEIKVNSIDEILPGSDDTTFVEVIPDEKSSESYDDIIEKEYLKELRKDLLALLDSVFGVEFTYKPYMGDFSGVDNVMSLFSKISNGVTSKEVLLLHYGLFGKSMTYADIGKKFQLSSARIEQIEANGIRTIRKSVFGQYFLQKYQDEDFQQLQKKKESVNLFSEPGNAICQIEMFDEMISKYVI